MPQPRRPGAPRRTSSRSPRLSHSTPAASPANPGSAIVGDYRAPFPFTGALHTVTLDLSGDLITDTESEMRMAMARQEGPPGQDAQSAARLEEPVASVTGEGVPSAGRPVTGSLAGLDADYPVTQFAVTIAVAATARPLSEPPAASPGAVSGRDGVARRGRRRVSASRQRHLQPDARMGRRGRPSPGRGVSTGVPQAQAQAVAAVFIRRLLTAYLRPIGTGDPRLDAPARIRMTSPAVVSRKD